MHTYKWTAERMRGIFPILVWYTTDKKKKRSSDKFKRKSMLSSLPGIGTKHTTTVIDPLLKTVYGQIQIGIANKIYDKLMNDEDNSPTTCKILKYIKAECIIRSMCYYDNRQRSFNCYIDNSNCYF